MRNQSWPHRVFGPVHFSVGETPTRTWRAMVPPTDSLKDYIICIKLKKKKKHSIPPFKIHLFKIKMFRVTHQLYTV